MGGKVLGALGSLESLRSLKSLVSLNKKDIMNISGLLVGIGFAIASCLVHDIVISTILGVTAFSCF